MKKIIRNHKTNTEAYRPKLHFTAKKGWINDPNGLIYTDGIYHMFFQHDPTNIKPEHMHWGHAVCTELFADSGKIYMSCLTDCNPNFSEFSIKSNCETKIERLELHSLDSVY